MQFSYLITLCLFLSLNFNPSFSQIRTTHIIYEELSGGKRILYDVIEENGFKRYMFSLLFRNEEYSTITDTKSISCFSKECLESFIRDLKDANISSNERSNLSWRREGYKYTIDKYDFTNNIYIREIDGSTNYTKLNKEELEKLILRLNDIDFGSEKLKSGLAYNPNELSKVELYKLAFEEFKKSNFYKSDSLFTIYKSKYPTEVYGYYWCFRSKSVIDSSMQNGLAISDCVEFIKIAESNIEKNKNTLITAYTYLSGYTASIKKDYPKALTYLNKILEIDPYNLDAQKNAQILEMAIKRKRD